MYLYCASAVVKGVVQNDRRKSAGMTAYFMAEVTVTDPEGYDAYRVKVRTMIEKYGGRVVTRYGGLSAGKPAVGSQHRPAAIGRRWPADPWLHIPVPNRISMSGTSGGPAVASWEERVPSMAWSISARSRPKTTTATGWGIQAGASTMCFHISARANPADPAPTTTQSNALSGVF